MPIPTGPGGQPQIVYYYPPPAGTDRTDHSALLAVIRALGEIGPTAKPAAAALRRAVEDAEADVAEAAAAALRKIGTAGDDR
jgi:hypothetical protein